METRGWSNHKKKNRGHEQKASTVMRGPWAGKRAEPRRDGQTVVSFTGHPLLFASKVITVLRASPLTVILP